MENIKYLNTVNLVGFKRDKYNSIRSYSLFFICMMLFCSCSSEKDSYKSKDTHSLDLIISSSSGELVEAFNWAKEKALSYVQTGKKGPIDISERNTSSDLFFYIPSYWAGYPGRSAFYSRDFCHQLSGAHLLGLHDENFSMMKAFAQSADESKKWFPLWAINFDGSPYKLDYNDDSSFVREVPAVFELVEKAYHLFLWTGDKRYFEDKVLWNYYTKAVTVFIDLHDHQIPNGVAEGTGKGIFEGAASYNEQHDAPLIESGDAIASQFKAFEAYAQMAKLRGEEALYSAFAQKSSDLKAYFNEDWGVKNTQSYNRGYLVDGEAVSGWGKENSWFMPMKNITDAKSTRTSDYLNFIDERLDSKKDMPNNIEALSYVPEVFFQHHRNELGWKWMKYIIRNLDQGHSTSDLTGRNGDYPEVSYVLIRNVVLDLLGVSPNAYENKISTLSHLPNEIKFLGVENIKFGNSIVSVRHESNIISKLKYEEGDEVLKWEVGFPGMHTHLFVNGTKEVCYQKDDHGLTSSWCSIELKKGDEIVVSITQ